ncbi:MAG: L-serine ammonia-lyase, iron-sulfur-dependent, subunit alpha [Christensenellales bacterium]
MNGYNFTSGCELAALCKKHSAPISEIMLRRQAELTEESREHILDELSITLEAMRRSVTEGLTEELESVSGLSGGDAMLLNGRAGNALSGSIMAEAAAASMAVVEVNASMGRIVAAPTAGASGILPGTLFTCAKERVWSDDKLISGLLCAGAIGSIIAANASISGAEHGCQAETGSAAAMAAAALCELDGGSPEKCLHAAAMALKNVMGLVCDPVAGLVECPCIKRNALGACNALICADMALAGIPSLIPFDETVSAMKSVGSLMSPDLRETARGGCAATPTGKAIRKQLGLSGEQD